MGLFSCCQSSQNDDDGETHFAPKAQHPSVVPSSGSVVLRPEYQEALDALLLPLVGAVADARYARGLCNQVFLALDAVARRLLVAERDRLPCDAMAIVSELCASAVDFVSEFSRRGWLLQSSSLAESPHHLEALHALAVHDLLFWGEAVGCTSDAIAAPPKTMSDALQELSALRKALAQDGGLAVVAGAARGRLDVRDAFVARLVPLLTSDDRTRLLADLHEELQVCGAELCIGPHRAIRHPDLRAFWWAAVPPGQEELPWHDLWLRLAAHFKEWCSFSDRIGALHTVTAIVEDSHKQSTLERAIRSCGCGGAAAGCSTVDLDLAFDPHMTVHDGLQHLLHGKDHQAAAVAAAAPGPGPAPSSAAAPVAASTHGTAAAAGWPQPGQGSAAAGASPTSVPGSSLRDDTNDMGPSSSYGTAGETPYATPAGSVTASPALSKLLPSAAVVGGGGGGGPHDAAAAGSYSETVGGTPPFATPAGSITGSVSASPAVSQLLPNSARPSASLGVSFANGAQESEAADAQDGGSARVLGSGTTDAAAFATPPRASFHTSLSKRDGVVVPPPLELPSPPFDGPDVEQKPATWSQRPFAPLVGRDADLQAVAQGFLTSTSTGGGAFGAGRTACGTRAVVLAGPPGVGKSALAVAVSARLVGQGSWQRTCCADMRHALTVDQAVAAICRALCVPLYDVPQTVPPAQRLFVFLERRSATLPSTGLILDNVDGLMPPLPGPTATSNPSAPPPTPSPADRTAHRLSSSVGRDVSAEFVELLDGVLCRFQGLQVMMTCRRLPPPDLWSRLQPRLPLAAPHSGSSVPTAAAAAVVWQHEFAPLDGKASATLLEEHAGSTLPEEQLYDLLQGCGGLPSMLRLVGRCIRNGVWLASAAGPTPSAVSGGGGGGPQSMSGSPALPAAPAASAAGRQMFGGSQNSLAGPQMDHERQQQLLFQTQAIVACVTSLAPERRTALRFLTELRAPLTEEQAAALLAPSWGPPAVVAGVLSHLYDFGLLHFLDLVGRHEVDTRVAAALLHLPSLAHKPPPAAKVRFAEDKVSSPAHDALVWASRLLDEVSQLHASGARRSALQLYSHHAAVVECILSAAAASACSDHRTGQGAGGSDAQVDEALQALAVRHLNGVCRDVTEPTIQLQLARCLIHLASRQHVDRPSGPSDSSQQALVAAGRALVHLGDLQQGEEQLVAAQAAAGRSRGPRASDGASSAISAPSPPQNLPAPDTAVIVPALAEWYVGLSELAAARGSTADAAGFAQQHVEALRKRGKAATVPYGQALARLGVLQVALRADAATTITTFEAAVTVLTSVPPAEVPHADLVRAFCGGAGAHHRAGNEAVAGRLLAIALETVEGTQGTFNCDAACVLQQAAEVHLSAGRAQTALEGAVRALRIYLEVLGDGSAQVVEGLHLLARCVEALPAPHHADAARVRAHASAVVALRDGGGVVNGGSGNYSADRYSSSERTSGGSQNSRRSDLPTHLPLPPPLPRQHPDGSHTTDDLLLSLFPVETSGGTAAGGTGGGGTLAGQAGHVLNTSTSVGASPLSSASQTGSGKVRSSWLMLPWPSAMVPSPSHGEGKDGGGKSSSRRTSRSSGKTPKGAAAAATPPPAPLLGGSGDPGAAGGGGSGSASPRDGRPNKHWLSCLVPRGGAGPAGEVYPTPTTLLGNGSQTVGYENLSPRTPGQPSPTSNGLRRSDTAVVAGVGSLRGGIATVLAASSRGFATAAPASRAESRRLSWNGSTIVSVPSVPRPVSAFALEALDAPPSVVEALGDSLVPSSGPAAAGAEAVSASPAPPKRSLSSTCPRIDSPDVAPAGVPKGMGKDVMLGNPLFAAISTEYYESGDLGSPSITVGGASRQASQQDSVPQELPVAASAETLVTTPVDAPVVTSGGA